MSTPPITNDRNWAMDFDIGRLVLSALFIIGIAMLLMFTPAANGNNARDNKIINKTLGLKGPEGKTPAEMGPAGKNNLSGNPLQQSRALREAEPSPGDEHQPYYIPSPDL